MHCVSEYPTSKPNLNNIRLLKRIFKNQVGYSDHTVDTLTPALSVIAGATLIEKHFTYNKDQKKGDHKISLNPIELKRMIKNIKLAEASLGNEKRRVSKKEKKLQFFAIKGIYLKKNKLKGEKIKSSDLRILRPQGYLAVDKLNIVLNKTLKKNVKSYSPIKISYFNK